MRVRSIREGEATTPPWPRQLQIKNILVPVDFSEPTMGAVRCAVSLARHFHACIHLVHVSPGGEDQQASGAADQMLQFGEIATFLQTNANDVREKTPECVWPKNCHLRSGKPCKEICATAQEIDADVIVMPTHGRTGLKQILLGSTTTRVINHARRPVLVLRLDSGDAEVAFRNILVPVDFSDSANIGIEYAASIAKNFGARLCLTHVAGHIRSSTEEESQDLEDSYRESNRRKLQILQLKAFGQGIPCDTLLLEGKPADEVVTAAKKRNADLIVIATPDEAEGHKSTSEEIARRAQTSVLVLPLIGFTPKFA